MRHLDVGALWLQEQALRRVVEFMKVKGTANPADLMTKHLARELFEQYTDALNIECRDDRASTAVKLHSTQQTREAPLAAGVGRVAAARSSSTAAVTPLDPDRRHTGPPTYNHDDHDDHGRRTTTATAQGVDPLLYAHSCHMSDGSYCSRCALGSALPVTSSASGALSQAR